MTTCKKKKKSQRGLPYLHAGEVEVARHSRACVAGVAILQLPAQALDLGLCHLLLKVKINDDALPILHRLQAKSPSGGFASGPLPCHARQGNAMPCIALHCIAMQCRVMQRHAIECMHNNGGKETKVNGLIWRYPLVATVRMMTDGAFDFYPMVHDLPTRSTVAGHVTTASKHHMMMTTLLL